MPLVGHAVAGWILAHEVEPRPDSAVEPASPPAAPATAPPGTAPATAWAPALVGLAYVPDVVAQIGIVVGWDSAVLAGHSILFALLSAPLLGLALARWFRFSLARGCAVAAGSVLLHDLLDILQGSDRRPLWPFSSVSVELPWALIPGHSWREVLLFAFVLTLYLLGRRGRPAALGASRAANIATLAIALLALATNGVRVSREQQLEAARLRIEGRDYQAGLQLLEQALSWPSTARAGRGDYLRGEAYLGLGDRDRAEQSYLKAYSADPSYFWVVADLAAFYASAPGPAAERRGRAAPYLERLRADFGRHPALPRTLARVERLLRE